MYRILLMSSKPENITDSLHGCEVVAVKGDLEVLMMLARDSNFDLILGDVGVPDNLANLRRKCALTNCLQVNSNVCYCSANLRAAAVAGVS